MTRSEKYFMLLEQRIHLLRTEFDNVRDLPESIGDCRRGMLVYKEILECEEQLLMRSPV